jgi:hypothetical protein
MEPSNLNLNLNVLIFYLQWAPLYGITVNGITLKQVYQSQITLLYLMYVSSSFPYCDQSVNVISLDLTQNDPIRRHLCTLIRILA